MKKTTARRRPESSELTIREVMTPLPVTVGQRTPLIAAHRTMNEQRVRHLPVLERGELVGVLTQRDLYFFETIRGVDIEKDVVEDAMTTEAYTVAPETPIGSVVRMMARKRYGCAVVIDRGKVMGIFTTTDGLRLLAGLLTPRQRRNAERTARAS